MAGRIVFVTGANRGFGRCVAVAAAAKWPDATLVLAHRPASEAQAKSVAAEVSPAMSTGSVSTAAIPDLANPADAQSAAADLFSRHRRDGCRAYFVSNAGSLGPLRPLPELTHAEVAEHCSSNIVAPLLLTQAFVAAFGKQAVLVNVSSLCAVKPFGGFTLYCQAKAARDMALRCAAEEGVRTLNYAPGPMDTDMAATIRGDHYDDGTRAMFTDLKEGGKCVDPAASARVLVALLDADKYESGLFTHYNDFADLGNVGA
eukprot:TRINITY_DN5037_c0_g1_i1.p1 TRINITY_DN5037_c0_g1~~TRINITY_DN5037_c0_g1_i1.p1  ORF type:complete len:283 (+),score=86.87 TRINITY_DN5037_c0_g1_i1:75-851(+)